MRTSPVVARSSPPSRCSSVLLPEPDEPTTATRSPVAISRSIPASTGTSTLPWWKTLRSPRHESTGPLYFSSDTYHLSPITYHSLLVAQRLRGIHLRRAPARIDRRDQGEDERDHRRRHHVGRAQLRGEIGDL